MTDPHDPTPDTPGRGFPTAPVVVGVVAFALFAATLWLAPPKTPARPRRG